MQFKQRTATTKVSPTGMRQQADLAINHEDFFSTVSDHQKCVVSQACAKDTATAYFCAFSPAQQEVPM